MNFRNGLTNKDGIKKLGKIIFDSDIPLNIENILQPHYTIEKYLPQDISDDYFKILLGVTNDGFGIEMSLEDIKNHIYKSNEVFLLKINGEIIGFSSIGNLGNFIYRFGTVIRKNFQGKGLYKILNNAIYNENKKYFVRTQNQNVIKSLEKIFDNVFIGTQALRVLENNGLSKEKINTFMLEKGDKEETLRSDGIFKGVYGGKMGENSRVNYIDKNFYNGFDAKNGDSLLVVYFNNKK